MSNSLGKDLFFKMMVAEFIGTKNQLKTGMLMNDEGKQLYIKQVHLKKPPANVDIIIQYAHVVTINGQLKSDPGVILGFDMINKEVYPILYRNDLLDHTIHVYQNGQFDQSKADWLLEYWSGWLEELKADDYDYVEQEQLKTA